MERLTEWVKDCPEPEEIHGVFIKDHDYIAAAHRLAEYEDTGLTPDEVQQLIVFEMAKAVAEITEFDGVPIQRLKELAAAEKTGDIDIVRHGHWIFKHKVRGGIRYRTGEDSWGNVHTIQCDDRYPTDDPYCSECHKLNDGSSLDWCPNCGAKMEGGEGNET